jgi:hypothetical protein
MFPMRQANSTATVARPALPSRTVALAILVAALGYFVDIYDLILLVTIKVE